jgi:hypothetical protein
MPYLASWRHRRCSTLKAMLRQSFVIHPNDGWCQSKVGKQYPILKGLTKYLLSFWENSRPWKPWILCDLTCFRRASLSRESSLLFSWLSCICYCLTILDALDLDLGVPSRFSGGITKNNWLMSEWNDQRLSPLKVTDSNPGWNRSSSGYTVNPEIFACNLFSRISHQKTNRKHKRLPMVQFAKLNGQRKIGTPPSI